MQLKYFVPFKAQAGIDAQFASREKLINIEGLAIDTSVNKNKWQVPEEDLDFFTETLKGAQLRADHAESVFMVVGKVPEARRQGQEVYFRAEVGGEEKLIDKILRGYIEYVSVQVDSDDVECSKCHKPTRNEGILFHLCPDAWEIVHKPRVRELSIVASPAYEKTEFKPVGFAAAMNESQKNVGIEFEATTYPSQKILERAQAIREAATKGDFSRPIDSIFWNDDDWKNFPVRNSQSCQNDKDVGSRRESQEPEKQQSNTREVKPMSEQQNAQQKASPHQAQGVVNVAPGEGAPKELTYQQYIDQLTQLKQQIMQKPGASDSELNDLQSKLADLEGELAKRARKAELGKKISELSKQLGEGTAEEQGEEGDEASGASAGAAQRASGKGIVGAIEGSSDPDGLGDYKWFNDLIKASRKLNAAGFKG
jgi:hypothetical protein